MNQEDFDATMNNLRMIERCNNKFEAWEAIYSLLGIPFRCSNPTEDEINAYLRKVAHAYKGKKPPKKG